MRMILVLLALVMGSAAQAQEFGLFGGINSSVFKTSGLSWKRKIGIGVGGQYFHTINENMVFRTGAGFVQKSSEVTDSGTTLETSFSYLEIPATLLFNINEIVGLIAGFNFDLKMADSCTISGSSNCTLNDAKSFTYSATFGGRFHVQDMHYIEALFELGLADINKNVKLDNSLAVQYAYKF